MNPSSHRCWEPLPSSALPFRHDKVVEGSRAWAALVVLYAHLSAPMAMVDSIYVPSGIFWKFEAALPAVMFFFLLSGYVIGLTKRSPASRVGTVNYLYRRGVRLLPIYLVAVTLGWLSLPGPSVKDLMGNYLLLQNAAPDNPTGVQLLRGNLNLWSLHYEALYYLMFLAVWWIRPRVWPTLAFLLVAGGCGVFVPGFPLWFAWLASGSILWLLGLYTAWRLPFDASAEKVPWPSALLLVVLTWKLEVTQTLLGELGFKVEWLPGVILPYLDSLPVLFWLFLMISRRRFAWVRALEIVVWAMPLAWLAWRLGRDGWPGLEQPMAGYLALALVALALRPWQPALDAFRRVAPIGGMSYGIYALGAPAQHFVLGLFPEFSGTWWTYALRVPLVLLLTFAAAWFFEIWLQPKIRALVDSVLFRSPKPTTIA
ncbi:acyltransferase [bacterium]|nr:acyltransferase [bacterium]